MTNKKHYWPYFLFITLSEMSYGQITTTIQPDGSIGSSSTNPITSTDGTYTIGQSVGAVKGKNLFHSFETFNIGSGDIATFESNSDINNIITRVTGGDSSSIYGTLKSNISGANLWLLNKNGVIFGSKGRIEVQGSFNVSTSDHLNFDDQTRFTSQLSNNPTLSTAKPIEFGILSHEAGDIAFNYFQGGINANRYQGLQVHGRNIRLKFSFIGDHYELKKKQAIGDITLTASESIISTNSKITNRISTSNDTTDNTSNNTTGNITMTAGQDIILSGGEIFTDNYSGAGNITLTAEQGDVQLNDGAYVRANASTNKAGDITVTAGNTVSLSGTASNAEQTASRFVSTNNRHAQSGTIKVTANQLSLEDGADIRTDSEKTSNNNSGRGSGGEGDIIINIEDSIRLKGDSHITSESNLTQANAGNITINADNIILDNSEIRSQTSTGTDNRAGNIDIDANFAGLVNESTIGSSATSGIGGSVNINSQLYSISDDSVIDTASGLTLSGSRLEREDALLTAEFAEDPSQLRNSCHYETTINPLSSTQRLDLTPTPTELLAIYTESTDNHTTPFNQLDTVDQLLAQSQQQQQQGQYNEAWRTLRKIYTSRSRALETNTLEKNALTTLSANEQARLLNTLGNNAIAINTNNNNNNNNKNKNKNTENSAEILLQTSLDLASKEKQPIIEAAAANNLANAYYYRQKISKATTLYQHSIRVSEQQGNINHALRAISNLSRLYVETKQVKAFNKIIQRGMTLLKQLPNNNNDSNSKSKNNNNNNNNNNEKTTLLIHFGHTWQHALTHNIGQAETNLTQAYTLFEQAQKLAQAQQDWRLASYAQGHLAQLYHYEERLDEALTLTGYALSHAHKSQSADALYRWHGQQGRLYWQQGKINQAMAAYRQSIAIIEESRQSSRTRYGSQRRYFQQQVSPIYRELVDLTLHSAAHVNDPAITEQLLYAARATLEKLNTRQLENYLNDECVTNYRKKYQELDHVADNAAIIYPIVLNDRIEIIVSLPTGKKDKPRVLKRYPVSIAQEKLHGLIEQYRKKLIEKNADHAQTVSQQLYDLLVRPYSKDLQNTTVTTLVFVPDDGLRDLPFAALHNGQTYLIRDYALAAASSLSIVDPKAIAPEKSSILSAGIADALDTLSALPWVPYELKSISRLYPGDRLLDEDFSLTNFRQSLQKRPYNIVHIASHAEFFPESSQGFIQAHDGRVSMSDLKALLQTRKYQETPVELLMLSACQTASGNRAEAFGLSGVAIQAGVRSVVGSLWDIDDEAAFHLVSAFYQALQSGNYSKAEALQQAQLALIDNKVFAHPYFWSPMMLMNNWL